MQPINLEAILPHLWISGRSSRAEWWRVHIICAVLATMLEHMMFAQLAPRDGGGMQPISLLWPIASLALMWVSFASVVRRFHDRGKSGWWALLYFVPGIGWLWILIECGFLPGKPAAQVTLHSRTSTGAHARRRVPAPRRGCRRRRASAPSSAPGCVGWQAHAEARRQCRQLRRGGRRRLHALQDGCSIRTPEVFTNLGPNESLPAFQKP